MCKKKGTRTHEHRFPRKPAAEEEQADCEFPVLVQATFLGAAPGRSKPARGTGRPSPCRPPYVLGHRRPGAPSEDLSSTAAQFPQARAHRDPKLWLPAHPRPAHGHEQPKAPGA